ncbi:MAG: hypothetical protein IPO93_05075 [Actinobacteria bacterium]|nr:hypothetical protein [Actinomycetota bacterium]
MSNQRHIASPLRSRRRSTADKIVSAGLATAACAGLVGVIGVRTIEQSVATQNDAAASTTTPGAAIPDSIPTSASGLTEADLDAYAAQLAAESTKLDAYRTKLVKTAKKLQAAQNAASQAVVVVPSTSSSGGTSSGGSSSSTVTSSKPVAKPVAKPAPKPVAKPAPQPAAKPQSNTKSS